MRMTWAGLEALIGKVLTYRPDSLGKDSLPAQIYDFDPGATRVVVLGGGTGLSTIVGGGSQRPDWALQPFVGLKENFSQLSVAVVTTDDGKSTGRLIRRLPLIGIGDLRKSCLSLIREQPLGRRYKLKADLIKPVVEAIQVIFNYRFNLDSANPKQLNDPVSILPARLKKIVPKELSTSLSELGTWIGPGGPGPGISPQGHCLGNLLLTAAVLRETPDFSRSPTLRAYRRGVDFIAQMIGFEPGCLHPVTSICGQLRFRYANGVEVLGQRKAALARRGVPVDLVRGVYVAKPSISRYLIRELDQADLVIYAPGSIYSSMIPLLQHPQLLKAIRNNHRALKLLAANFWIQEGETDLAPGFVQRGFRVSDLIKAYEKNLPGGARGLFDLIISSNLDQVTGETLGQYAREGKQPIFLDREEVERLGLPVLEADLFPPDLSGPEGEIHHDPTRFSLLIKTILYAQQRHGFKFSFSHEKMTVVQADSRLPLIKRGSMPCSYLAWIKELLELKTVTPPSLRQELLEVAWANRDIPIKHYELLKKVTISAQVTRKQVGVDYFGATGEIRVADSRLDSPFALRSALLIGLGEAVFGNSISPFRIRGRGRDNSGPGTLEVRLNPVSLRRSGLNDRQLRTFLELIRMVPASSDPDLYHLLLNSGEGFWPPGLLFGMLYAWYLDSRAVPAMEYEMAVLRRSAPELLPWQIKEWERRRALVDFFREEVFEIR